MGPESELKISLTLTSPWCAALGHELRMDMPVTPVVSTFGISFVAAYMLHLALSSMVLQPGIHASLRLQPH